MSAEISSLTTTILSLLNSLINSSRSDAEPPPEDKKDLEARTISPIDVCFILEKIINPQKYLQFINDSRHKIDLFTELDSVTNYLKTKRYDTIVLGMVLAHKKIYENEPEGNLETGVYLLRDLRNGGFGALNKSTDVTIYTYNDGQSIQEKVKGIDPKIIFLNPRDSDTFGRLTRYFDNLKNRNITG